MNHSALTGGGRRVEENSSMNDKQTDFETVIVFLFPQFGSENIL
jgi:hypothetical protein